jgi:hypothetical protein
MRIVGDTGPAIDQALRGGQLTCPLCEGALRPWGRARLRVIRFDPAPHRPVHPRRARCATCRTTHVLLPDWMLVRRAYAAPIIWSALTAQARGLGYRRIALRMHLPETTVRDWLRAFRRNGPRLLAQLAHPEPASTSAALLIQPKCWLTTSAALLIQPKCWLTTSPVLVLERLSPPLPAWRFAVRVSAGRLLANTSPPHRAGTPPSARPP